MSSQVVRCPLRFATVVRFRSGWRPERGRNGVRGALRNGLYMGCGYNKNNKTSCEG